jgi:hypothetical protein
LSALGLTAGQLPDLAALMPLPEGIKAYPDQPRLNNEPQDGSVSGSRDQDIALIASRPGRYQLPAVRLAWWDTTRNSPREAILPAHTLEILPAAGGGEVAAAPSAGTTPASPSGPLPVAAPGGTRFPWPWLSLALGLFWLATLAAWWRARRASPAPAPGTALAAAGPDASRAGVARKAFHQACRDNAAPAARQHLLAWARATWPHDPPAGPTALARRLGNPSLPPLLRELDRACYAGGEWHGKALAEALVSLPRAAEKAGGKGSQLSGLYP